MQELGFFIQRDGSLHPTSYPFITFANVNTLIGDEGELKTDTAAHRQASLREPFPPQLEAVISLYSAGLHLSGDSEDLR